MQSLAQLISELSFGDPALWVAISAGLGVVLIFLFLGRRPTNPRQREIVESNPDPERDNWDKPPAVSRHDERRRSLRRSGLPTPLHVIDAKGSRRAKVAEAFVLDRSTGGLRLAVEKPYPIGHQLKAKPSKAPESFEWVNLVVRNSKETGDYFEIGCQFDSELELNRLLMFG
jgi:PilZ domain